MTRKKNRESIKDEVRALLVKGKIIKNKMFYQKYSHIARRTL